MAERSVADKVDSLKQYLEKRLRGQPRAIDSVCRTYEYIITLRNLEKRKGPLGTFLFLGPSGVGKTEMARLMAAYFSGSENSLIKIPCVGFSQPHMIHSIIGAPHGYIGFDKKPVLSQEYIDSKIASKKTVPVKRTELDDLGFERRKFSDRIKSLHNQVSDSEDKIETNMSLINFLGAYDKFLNSDGVLSNGSKSLREILSDSDMGPLVLSLLKKEAAEVLGRDLRNPISNAALTMDLYATTKSLIEQRQQAQDALEASYYHLGHVSEVTRIMRADQASLIVPKTPPRIVILFDEIEKSNETLHNLLLEIMEDGKVTLANNNVTDLSNAFIVLTGNIGAKPIGDAMRGRKSFGFSSPNKHVGKDLNGESRNENLEDLEKKILVIAEKELRQVFTSEFRGRLDDIIIFRPLSLDSFYKILDYQIELFKEALGSMGVELDIDAGVRKIIVESSLHRPEVGARLLSHKFKSLVKIPLGRHLFERDGFKGKAKVTSSGQEIKFSFT